MNAFTYRQGMLCAEELPLAGIAERFGTPCYVYSCAALAAAYNGYRNALAGRSAHICYAVKANSNLAILNLFARLGAGFDIVSGGELARVLAAGGLAADVVFSGVGKTREELRAALTAAIGCFNVESESELIRLSGIAEEMGLTAPIALRVNPDVDAKTHPYISTGLKNNKFGIAIEDALPLYRRARIMPRIKIKGIASHIGSQLLDPAPAAEAAQRVLALADRLAAEGIDLADLDLGGGMGIRYRDEDVPGTAEYLAPMLDLLKDRRERLVFAPGRSLVGAAGLLLTRVEVVKHGAEKSFAIVDAAMNDLMRPALYDAWHDILPVRHDGGKETLYEVVGPVCESGDFLGHGRSLAIVEDDLLAVMCAGAYGMAMSSNYNSRPRAAEVLVDGGQAHLIRERESVALLYERERIVPL